MPVESVIVDDGGSTRIRWNNGGQGHMPGLPKGLKETITPGTPFTQVRIVCLDEEGIPYHCAMLFTEVQISSQMNQSVKLKRAGKGLEITLSGSGASPQVVDNLHGDKHHYTVTNAGAIEKVAVDGTHVSPTVNKTVLYTSVALS